MYDYERFFRSVNDWISYIDLETYSKVQIPLALILRKHFSKFGKLAEEDYVDLAGLFIHYKQSAYLFVREPREAIDGLAELQKHLKHVRAIWRRLPEEVRKRVNYLAWDISAEHVVSKPTTDPTKDNFEEILEVPEMAASSAFHTLVRHSDEYLEVISSVESHASAGPPRGRKAIDGWRVIEAAAKLCRQIPGTISVPRFMNESGPFYAFLGDLFDFFEISEQPTSVFRSWRKHVDNDN